LTFADGGRYGCADGEGHFQMIVAPLLGTALVVAVATSPLTDPAGDMTATAQQKAAAMEPLVKAATDCIVHTAVANPRAAGANVTDLGDVIVASVPPCLAAVRAMIDAHDRYYGNGTGEAFFMGPYLDALPRAVVAAAKNAGR
jgi:hypothetical protein